MVAFTASRRTFAFAAESLGLFHFLPSFFSCLSSALKSQCLRKKKKRRGKRERSVYISSEVNFMVNYNSGKVWPRYVLVARYAKQFYSFPLFPPPRLPSPSRLPFSRGANLYNIQAGTFSIYRTFVHRNWGCLFVPIEVSEEELLASLSRVICESRRNFILSHRPSIPRRKLCENSIFPAKIARNSSI